MNNTSNKVGTPAWLEKAAMECFEMGMAYLDLARAERGEDPTMLKIDEAVNRVCETASDVMVSTNALVESGLISYEALDSVAITKLNKNDI